MSNLISKSLKIEKSLKDFFIEYENLFRESNNQFMSERSSSGTMDGLDDFYRLVNTIRRNRDVAGSLLRGFKNLRPINKFRFIEEEEVKLPKKRGKKEEPVPERMEELTIQEPETEKIDG